MTFKTRRARRRGIALIIVLGMIVLITVLVVGFTVNMRTERQAARSMTENERAKLVADAALTHAIGILSSNIPQPAPPIQPGQRVPPAVNWVVNPGLLTLVTGPADVTQIPLSSNPGVDYAATANDANLNLARPESSYHPILGTGEPMCVAWVPMLQNPALSSSNTNPIVARYAFWMDDENAKINVNTAYGKPSGMDYSKLTPGVVAETATSPAGRTDNYPLGHPGSVNLEVLGAAIDKTALLNNLWANGVSNSPEAIKGALMAGVDPAGFYEANKFVLTATSRDPEFNVFGKPRIFQYGGPVKALSDGTLQYGGRTDQLGGALFQRFRDLDAPMYFHGNENGRSLAQDKSAMYYTAASLSTIFDRRDWPGMPARSFTDKWDKDASGQAIPQANPGDVGKREADQVAWNMVVMGSFCDFNFAPPTASPAPVAPLVQISEFGNGIPLGKTGSAGSNLQCNYPNAAASVGSLSGKAIVPAAPRPMVDEICLNILPEAVSVAGKSMCRLLFKASYGVWLPPHYPAANFGQTAGDLYVGLTHLEYDITQATGTGANPPPPIEARQADSKYLNDGYEGVKKFQAGLTSGTMAPGARQQLTSIAEPIDPTHPTEPTVPPLFYARNGAGFNNTKVGVTNFDPNSGNPVRVTVRMRLYVHSNKGSSAGPATSGPPIQLIPVWDTHDPGAAAAPTGWNPPTPPAVITSQIYKSFSPPLDDHRDYVEFKFNLDLGQLGTQLITRSLQVADPRAAGLSRSWQASWLDAAGQDQPAVAITDTTSLPHNAATDRAVSGGWNLDKFAYIDMSAGAATPVHPSIGLFSVVPTGMQRGIAGSTFKLGPNPQPAELPDWLLLDLVAPTCSSNAWGDLVQMSATAGKINVNASVCPNKGAFRPPVRDLPLQALFINTPAGPAVAANIINHTLSAAGAAYPAGQSPGAKFYNYPGEICEIAGVADIGVNDWVKEATIRNLASALTTKSNTFCVWGVAQSLKKLRAHTQFGLFEPGDIITGEKRFQAIVERYVWPGVEGIAGNAHAGSDGKFDRLQGAIQPGNAPPPANGCTWEALDGPDAPTYPTAEAADGTLGVYNQNAASSYTGQTTDLIDTAYNPVRAVMKYRVIYFKYLE